MEIWAHRGRLTPDTSGNTLSDFQKTYEFGIRGIETDVCLMTPAEDNSQRPVVYHPNPKNGGNSKGKVLCLDDFMAFLVVHPTLSCCLEIKQENDNLLNQTVDAIMANHLEQRVYITAFQTKIAWLGLETSGKVLKKARKRNPLIKTHLIVTFPLSLPALARNYSPNIISLGWMSEPQLSEWFFKRFLAKIVNLKSQINQVQNMGIKIIGGIVNEKKNFEYFANLGVNGIMTDNSVAAIEFIKTKSP